MEALKIFIGWDAREAEAADVLAWSLRKHSSVLLDIRMLKLAELDFNRPRDPLQSTDFAFSRFLVPELCGFAGRAAFMDCDVLCRGDVAPLGVLPLDSYALACVQFDYRPQNATKMDGCVQTVYPRKLWSSVVVFNCAKLTLWRKQIVETASGAFLHRFQGIPDEELFLLDRRWNEIEEMRPDTVLFHYTNGGPWFESYRNCPGAEEWLVARDEWRASCSRSSS